MVTKYGSWEGGLHKYKLVVLLSKETGKNRHIGTCEVNQHDVQTWWVVRLIEATRLPNKKLF